MQGHFTVFPITEYSLAGYSSCSFRVDPNGSRESGTVSRDSMCGIKIHVFDEGGVLSDSNLVEGERRKSETFRRSEPDRANPYLRIPLGRNLLAARCETRTK